MKTFFVFLFLITILLGWKYNYNLISKKESFVIDIEKNKIAKEIPGSIKAVENFLIWYNKNYNKISKIRLVDNEIDTATQEVYYRVSFQQTEEYLAKLKSSNYISDKYIEKWRAYFKKRDEKFKTRHQSDGTPLGFEYDFILWTQQINETLKAIDNIEFVKFNETVNSSVVDVDIVMNLRFYLTKYSDGWKIDEIENI
jgi:hypothetical protein